MVAVLVLAVVAAVFIRSLMHVVARDEGGGFPSATADYAPVQTYDPTVQIRARVNDDARGFLLPAAMPAGDHADDLDRGADRTSQHA
jgi:hypothetical protein